jgi:hypothetical protein
MGHPLGVNVLEILGDDRVLTQAEVDENNIFSFDPAAARNLDLPAEADNAGVVLFIANTANAAEVITIRDDAAGTVCTPTQAESAMVWCDGVSWRGLVGAFA